MSKIIDVDFRTREEKRASFKAKLNEKIQHGKDWFIRNKEYVITTPLTPYPWINYLGTQDFFSLISNTAGGYSFFKDAKLRRITRFRYNNVPLDMGGGRYFYLYD